MRKTLLAMGIVAQIFVRNDDNIGRDMKGTV
jgi:hypothetical protein